LQLNIWFGYFNIVCAVIALPFGYDLFFRTGVRVAGSFFIGLVVGVLASAGMSVVVSAIFNQGIFPDLRQSEDFVETTITIMLAYATGNATANLVSYLWLDATSQKSTLESIRAIILAVRARRGAPIAHQIRSLEGIIKALVAVVLAVGTLLVAIRELLF
jgi:hypothetical protein